MVASRPTSREASAAATAVAFDLLEFIDDLRRARPKKHCTITTPIEASEEMA